MRAFKTISCIAALSLAFPLSASSATEQLRGYLAAGTFDILAVLPPAPERGDPRYDADRRIFRATRKWLGTPRGDLAANDVNRSPAAMLDDFSCALGASLRPDQLPRTVALIERASIDTNVQKDRAKDFYKRMRPLFIDKGPVCQPRSKLAKTFDYPSGHTTGGWTWALILARLAPDKATAILARGRAFGQSRIVCGAHNASAVEAGFMTASATMAMIETVPEFQRDLSDARLELSTARRSTPAPGAERCRQEAALVALRVF